MIQQRKDSVLCAHEIQWNPSNADTIATTALCLEYRDVCISKASPIYFWWTCQCILMLLRAMKAHSISPLLYAGEKANQSPTLCVPMLLYCPVVESISGNGQACARSMRTSRSEFCTVQVLEGLKNLSSLQNSKVRLYTNICKCILKCL